MRSPAMAKSSTAICIQLPPPPPPSRRVLPQLLPNQNDWAFSAPGAGVSTGAATDLAAGSTAGASAGGGAGRVSVPSTIAAAKPDPRTTAATVVVAVSEKVMIGATPLASAAAAGAAAGARPALVQ